MTGENASVVHERVFNCWVLEDNLAGELSTAILWAVLLILWVLNTHCFNKDNASFIQRLLFLIPLLEVISYSL